MIWQGSGCGSVGRAVAPDTKGTRFESSHRQKFIYVLNIYLLSTVYWKDKNKEKEAGNGPFLKNHWDYKFDLKGLKCQIHPFAFKFRNMSERKNQFKDSKQGAIFFAKITASEVILQVKNV